MPHPGDDGGLRPLFDGDSLGSSDRAAADGRGVIGNRLGEPLGEFGVARMKGEETDHGPGEVFDVCLLRLFPSLGIGFPAFGEARSGSLGF
jgi:hypothetical protein